MWGSPSVSAGHDGPVSLRSHTAEDQKSHEMRFPGAGPSASAGLPLRGRMAVIRHHPETPARDGYPDQPAERA